MKRNIFLPHVLLSVAIAVLLLFFLDSCGGGFSTDSENAPDYQRSFFGRDTLEN